MDRQTREMIEDMANLVALQVVRPIEQRLTVLETKIQCGYNNNRSTVSTRWKVIGLCMTIPGWFVAVFTILKFF